MSDTIREAPTYSERHPHEPEIPPAWDNEGRCLVCVLTVSREELRKLAAERGDQIRALMGEAAAKDKLIEEAVPYMRAADTGAGPVADWLSRAGVSPAQPAEEQR